MRTPDVSYALEYLLLCVALISATGIVLVMLGGR